MQKTLSERDRDCIWHPYTSLQTPVAPLAIARGEGAFLIDELGNRYLDAISSWWVTIHGHAHPYIARKIYEQAVELEQVIFAGFTHRPAVELAERLLPLLPGNFEKIFYSDNGSTAVEVAVKMAIQYWSNSAAGAPGSKQHRTTILAFKHAYHGDTFGAMSVSARGIFTDAFREQLFNVHYIDTPTEENIDLLHAEIERVAPTAAAFIYEPLLQGAGGMRIYDAALLNKLLQQLKQHEVICIADEVLTGFGRTGQLFAGNLIATKADIICLSKGLTGGTMALGVTACSPRITAAFNSPDKLKTFYHGHSFTANPIACAAALASLDLLLAPDCVQHLAALCEAQTQFRITLSNLAATAPIKDVRQIGTLLAFELVSGTDSYLNDIGRRVTAYAMSKGVYLRPLGNTVYCLPPYCLDADGIRLMHEVLFALADVDALKTI